jgi:tRNA nucleotidyltransferase (CCA-adding enzyme)
MYDPLTNKVLDFHNGLRDLEDKKVKIIDPQTFQEDPLRVYRAASICSRLGFKLGQNQTLKTCRKMLPELKHLSKERISEEWKKILLDSPAPSVGLKILEEIGVIRRYYPELEAMIGCPQEPLWHPEGDVWTHTLIALDYAAKKTKKDRLTIMLAILLHDIGKPRTTKKEKDKIRSRKHETRPISGPLIRQFLKRLVFSDCNNRLLAKKVENLAVEHMTPYQLGKNLGHNLKIDKALRRLSVRLKPATIAQLIELTEIDYWATKGKNKDPLPSKKILAKARELKIEQKQPQPLLTGKDLIKQGRKPGPSFGKILKAAYEQQLDGKIATRKEALKWLKSSPQF